MTVYRWIAAFITLYANICNMHTCTCVSRYVETVSLSWMSFIFHSNRGGYNISMHTCGDKYEYISRGVQLTKHHSHIVYTETIDRWMRWLGRLPIEANGSERILLQHWFAWMNEFEWMSENEFGMNGEIHGGFCCCWWSNWFVCKIFEIIVTHRLNSLHPYDFKFKLAWFG